KEGGGLDEAHVQRDAGRLQQPRRLAGGARDTLRVGDDAGRQAAPREDPSRLLGVRYGHPAMLPVGARGVCAGVAIGRAAAPPPAKPPPTIRPCAEIVHEEPSVSTAIAPSRSVRNTWTPAARSVRIVIGAGCP